MTSMVAPIMAMQFSHRAPPTSPEDSIHSMVAPTLGLANNPESESSSLFLLLQGLLLIRAMEWNGTAGFFPGEREVGGQVIPRNAKTSVSTGASRRYHSRGGEDYISVMAE